MTAKPFPFCHIELTQTINIIKAGRNGDYPIPAGVCLVVFVIQETPEAISILAADNSQFSINRNGYKVLSEEETLNLNSPQEGFGVLRQEQLGFYTKKGLESAREQFNLCTQVLPDDKDSEQKTALAYRMFLKVWVELEVGAGVVKDDIGYEALWLAEAWAGMGSILLRRKKHAEAMPFLESAAQIYWRNFQNDKQKYPFSSTSSLEYAEMAGTLFGAFGVACLNVGDVNRAVKAAQNILDVEMVIKKRYEAKVTLLIQAAELFFETDHFEEAQESTAKADRFFSQQLSRYLEFPPHSYHYKSIRALSDRIKQLKQDLSESSELPEREVKFSITADTESEAIEIVDFLKAKCGDGLKVTRKVAPTPVGKDPRNKLRFTANFKLTLRN